VVARLWRTALSSVTAPAMAALMMMPLMGCSSYIFRTFDVDSGENLSIDARQRVVLVTHQGGKTRDRTVVCAEPSPDVLTAQAASGSASGAATLPAAEQGGTGQSSFSGSIAGASSEAAASIAMRSQTIQLLRDGLFRACEAYMNGGIDQHQYNVVLLNIHKLMVTLLGVDAIGGMPTTPAVTLGVAGKADDQAAIESRAAAQADTKSVQAEAAANIVLAANARSSAPDLCISLLASGELRLDDPGQRAVLERCDHLLAAVVNNLVNRTRQPTRSYKMSQPQPAPAAAPELAATKQPHNKQPPKRVAVVSTARIERTTGSRAAETASAPELTFQPRWPAFSASPSLPCEIALNCDPSFN
jgi:hypothetical protein